VVCSPTRLIGDAVTAVTVLTDEVSETGATRNVSPEFVVGGEEVEAKAESTAFAEDRTSWNTDPTTPSAVSLTSTKPSSASEVGADVTSGVDTPFKEGMSESAAISADLEMEGIVINSLVDVTVASVGISAGIPSGASMLLSTGIPSFEGSDSIF